MKIVKHQSPLHFPYGVHPKQPTGIMVLSDWRDQSIALLKPDQSLANLSYQECWFWPALVGLDKLSYPIMAHFAQSEGFFWPGGRFFSPRAWIQLTTLSEENDPFGVPLVVKGTGDQSRITVECLWRADGETYTAYDQFADGTVNGNTHPAEFWAEFFTEILLAKRIAAETTLERATREADRMQRILSAIPV